jgi:hypothetical protein
LLAAAFWAQRCGAQSTGFAPGQINTTMCQWQTPRGMLLCSTALLQAPRLY